MRRSSLPLLLLAATAAGAVPAAALHRGEAALVRLEAPRGGETLTAGSTAELAWAPLVSLGDAEEWEAFLSLDGGATWPVRITPHLDRELRRVRFQVPGLPTADARLLLRFGDERRETAVELPQRFAIAEPPGGTALLGITSLARLAPGRGEPALPGRPGVVAWVEGSRNGGASRPVVAAPPLSLEDAVHTPATGSEPAVLATGEGPVQLTVLPAARGHAAPPIPRRPLRTAGAQSGLASSDILLLTQRQNE
ncbi:MAG TPA: hypothetical protein VF173_18315 [Thermoanaerobaculia bacterium]|nr:hypothetical protein [Thermoanaerobaculia bacterium]